MIKQKYTVITEEGLHARPATILVEKASEYESDIVLVNGDRKVNAKSIMGVMSLGLGQNDSFYIQIEGNDAEEASLGIKNLFKSEGIAE